MSSSGGQTAIASRTTHPSVVGQPMPRYKDSLSRSLSLSRCCYCLAARPRWPDMADGAGRCSSSCWPSLAWSGRRSSLLRSAASLHAPWNASSARRWPPRTACPAPQSRTTSRELDRLLADDCFAVRVTETAAHHRTAPLAAQHRGCREAGSEGRLDRMQRQDRHVALLGDGNPSESTSFSNSSVDQRNVLLRFPDPDDVQRAVPD